MMETAHKITLHVEATDEEDLVDALHEVIERIEEGKINKLNYFDKADGHYRYEKEERCEYCHGEGEVSTDVDDGEGHTMHGVGTEKCVCQK